MKPPTGPVVIVMFVGIHGAVAEVPVVIVPLCSA